MITELIIGAAILFIAILLMGVKVFFTKKGKFPNTHIGGNPYLRDKGIHCASTQDWEARNKKNPMEIFLKSEE